MPRNLYKIIGLSLLMAFSQYGWTQSISMDRGVRVNGLWCFPLVDQPLRFRYLPDEARLALSAQNQPQFSFVRYVDPMEKTGRQQNTLVEVGGGGVLHFLVEYSAAPRRVQGAGEALRELLQNDSVELLGPVIFKEGRFALVSSILQPDGKNTERVLMSAGAAPVLEGTKVALSFELDPTRSRLLLESFKMATPDVSLMFDLGFSGLTDAFDAKLSVDWSELSRYERFKAGGSVYFVSGEVETTVEELIKNNTIKLETSGADEKTEALLSTVYNKIVELLFEREQQPQADQAGGNFLENMIRQFSGGSSGGGNNPFSFLSVNASYKHRNVKKEGKTQLTFNSRTVADRRHLIAFNIGDLHRRFGENQRFFKTVSLDDPDFLTREISIGVDGELAPEFDRLINSVTVQLRKRHQNGEETLREARVLKSTLGAAELPVIAYGSLGDADRQAWYRYDYHAIYQFQGGKRYETEWISQSGAMINLFVPYERRTIRLEGDPTLLQDKQVRALQVKIDYPFFGETRRLQQTLKPNELPQGKSFEITLPRETGAFNYQITWFFQDGSSQNTSGSWESDILFVDNL